MSRLSRFVRGVGEEEAGTLVNALRSVMQAAFHHGDFLHESSVRIPLILRWRGHLPEGVVVEHQVRSIDVAPTLLELAKLPLDDRIDGRSLSGGWTALPDDEKRVFQRIAVAPQAKRREPVVATRDLELLRQLGYIR